jgi:hypothetical protein
VNVRNIDITTSPLSPDRTCVRADVICDDTALPPEEYWIDVPSVFSDRLNTSGNAWLVLLLPLAVTLGECLTIDKPVDRELLINLHELMHVWHRWYDLKPVRIEVEVQDHHIQPSSGATAALFSGGVDAWFTLLTHNDGRKEADSFSIDDLLCIWGLDVRLAKADEFRALCDSLKRATTGFGTAFVDVATNLFDTAWQRRGGCWHRAHNCALASIAHVLSGHYGRLLIPSTHRYDDAIPWGSHPLTDPLLSSSQTKIIHDGAGFSRVEKTEVLIKSDTALNSLQVCWATGSYRNCETCGKCYRTMTTLFLLGALSRCARFHSSTIDTAKIAKIFTREESDRVFLREVRSLAVRTGRLDIARAIDRSFRHSRRLQLCFHSAHTLLRIANPTWQQRLNWRIERLLLRSSIL